MRAAIPFAEIAKRHNVEKTMAFRHRRHMDAAPAVQTDGDEPEFDLKAILRTAQKALVRAMRKNDLKAIDIAYSLLQKLQRDPGVPAEQGSSIDTMADEATLDRRRTELLKTIYRGRVDDWRDYAQRVTDALMEPEQGSTMVLPEAAASHCNDTIEMELIQGS